MYRDIRFDPLARGRVCSWAPTLSARLAGSIRRVKADALTTEGVDVFDETWDAGDLGCGELVLELRWRLERLAPDEVIRIIALDPGAPVDIPAWCRMTGHALLEQEHPVYLIRRRRPPVP
jgi:tRNA 2-thiouridine synthesizing protein A